MIEFSYFFQQSCGRKTTVRIVRIDFTAEKEDVKRGETKMTTNPGKVKAIIEPFRLVPSPKKRERYQPDLRENEEWHSRLRVYEDEAFERLRMPRSPHWSVIWSDLMMTMFILFVVLYVYHSLQRETVVVKVPTIDIGVGSKINDRGPIEPFSEHSDRRMARIYDLSRQVIDEESMQNIAKVDLAPDKTVRIILKGDLLFDSGSAEIKESAVQDLRKIIPLFSQTPDMINVVGHTDDIPIHTKEFPSNWELSLVRASTIARFLMQEANIAENRFYVSGHGSTQPIAANDTSEHRAANRRVEIILTKEKPTAITNMEGVS